jgi:hypothetical protein
VGFLIRRNAERFSEQEFLKNMVGFLWKRGWAAESRYGGNLRHKAGVGGGRRQIDAEPWKDFNHGSTQINAD